MPAYSENVIDADFDYRSVEAAEDELVSLSTALDIEIENDEATPQVVDPADIRDWIESNWQADRAIPAATYRIEAVFDSPVPSTGFLFLSHAQGTPHSNVGFGIDVDSSLRRIYVALDEAEPTNTYDIRVYENPTDASPTLVVSNKLTIEAGSTRTFQVHNLVGVDLPAGEYGIAIERLTGSGESTFANGTVLLVVEEQ